jgi:parallel beta-helix repeat protein
MLQNLAIGSLQWVMNNILSQSNGGDGYLITSVNGAASASISVSNMSGIFSFANSGEGFAVVGSASQPIYGPRLTNSFFGQDGNAEVLFVGYGGDVQITDSFFELSGSIATGPNGTTAASHIGSGIEIDNGTNIKISNNVIDSMSVHGIFLSGGLGITVNGNTITNNGQNTSSAALGIFVAPGAVADITSNSIFNTGGLATQNYGINNSGTINVEIGNNLKPNALGTYIGTPATIGGATLNNQ